MTKKNNIALLCALVVISLVAGCAYSHTQRPLDNNFDNTQLGSREGRSHSHCVLWLFAWGDSGTRAAADNAGITTIKHADTEVKMILFGLYTRVTTVVYGD